MAALEDLGRRYFAGSFSSLRPYAHQLKTIGTDGDEAALAYWKYRRLPRGKAICQVRIAFMYKVTPASV
jgi:hypothetical protein